jgi:hypothetical protein
MNDKWWPMTDEEIAADHDGLIEAAKTLHAYYGGESTEGRIAADYRRLRVRLASSEKALEE